jgi:hypothetical protein
VENPVKDSEPSTISTGTASQLTSSSEPTPKCQNGDEKAEPEKSQGRATTHDAIMVIRGAIDPFLAMLGHERLDKEEAETIAEPAAECLPRWVFVPQVRLVGAISTVIAGRIARAKQAAFGADDQ